MRSGSRRNFLRAVGGAVLSLPWLESIAETHPGGIPPVRLGFFYLPNGLVRRGFFPGETDRELPSFASQNNVWRFEGEHAPVGTHPLTFTPTLEPLHPLRGKVALLTGLDRKFQNGTDSHAQAASCYLTSSAPYQVLNSVYPLARTLDHVAADLIGTSTPFATLELSCNDSQDNIESIYFDNMSWYGPGHVAPSMRSPRRVYDRLFSTKQNSRYRNITDLVLGNAKNLQQRLGKADRHKFSEYVESIRTIEVRMDKVDVLRSQINQYKPERPRDFFPRNEYIHIMGDLMITAFQAGLTNVSTLMIAPERWTTTNKYEGILDQPRSHHSMTHSQTEFLEDLLKLDRFHVAAFARLLKKMDTIEEAHGTTLLDNTIFTLGAGLGDGATHQYNDLPVIVAGGGGGRLTLGQHVQCAPGTPLANLWLTQLQALGSEMPSFADSTRPLASLLS